LRKALIRGAAFRFLRKPARSKGAETPMFTPELKCGLLRIFQLFSNFCAKLRGGVISFESGAF
jgi:hypothetical protein